MADSHSQKVVQLGNEWRNANLNSVAVWFRLEPGVHVGSTKWH